MTTADVEKQQHQQVQFRLLKAVETPSTRPLGYCLLSLKSPRATAELCLRRTAEAKFPKNRSCEWSCGARGPSQGSWLVVGHTWRRMMWGSCLANKTAACRFPSSVHRGGFKSCLTFQLRTRRHPEPDCLNAPVPS